ncbi:hypothetical protein BaRGS_00006981 [Batillaria attramentaria]|uniref:Uncharacterized protein n=1 Tax=Batillaria attramentaria TaxID=370345 RepID=A0ABD0LQW6_9CAEN
MSFVSQSFTTVTGRPHRVQVSLPEKPAQCCTPTTNQAGRHELSHKTYVSDDTVCLSVTVQLRRGVDTVPKNASPCLHRPQAKIVLSGKTPAFRGNSVKIAA